jgi:Ser/Thr protein kinase RdoA (MazF antagonist)
MLSLHAEGVAAAFGLGTPTSEVKPVARGEQGSVWRLDTERGSYAVKEPFELQSETDAAGDVEFQEAVLAQSNVPLLPPVRTTSGSIFGDVVGQQFRVYEWVDLLPVNTDLDPALVGETVAAIHRVRHDRPRPLHPWYTDPVGASRWAEMSSELVAAGAPFGAAFASEVPSLIELEGLIEPPRALQSCHRDLFADNILPTPAGEICVIDWENCGLEDPSHELAVVLYDFAYASPSRAATLCNAYRDGRGPGRLRNRGHSRCSLPSSGTFSKRQPWSGSIRNRATKIEPIRSDGSTNSLRGPSRSSGSTKYLKPSGH